MAERTEMRDGMLNTAEDTIRTAQIKLDDASRKTPGGMNAEEIDELKEILERAQQCLLRARQ